MVLLAVLTCVACGGGSGSGSADGTSTAENPSVGSATGTPTLDVDALIFTAYVDGEIPDSQVVRARFRGDRLVMSPHSDDFPDWLHAVKNPNDTGRDQRYTFNVVTIDMAPGAYTQTITLQDEEDMLIGDELIGTLSFPVTLNILDEIHISQDSITFNSVEGASRNPDSQVLEVSGTTASWTASSPNSWIDVMTTTNVGAGALEIGISLADASLPVGAHTGTVTIIDNGSGTTAELMVNVLVEPRRLHVVDNGLAFTDYPGGGKLSNSVVVADNGTQDTVWQLYSSVPWITPNQSSGTAGDTLILNANSSGLSPGLYTGVVNVSSTDAQVSNTEEIAVGLYVSNTTPADSIEAVGIVTGSPVDVISDPIRPYVYTVSADTDIRVYHLYTGEEVTTVTVPGANLRALTVASDGSTLFVANAADFSIIKVDLSTFTVQSTISGDLFDTCENCNDFQLMTHYLGLEFTRTNGKELLITNGHKVVDAENGSVIYDFDAVLTEDYWCCDHDPSIIAAAADGHTVYLQELGVSAHSLIKLNLEFSRIDSEPFKVLVDKRVYEDGNARDIAVDQGGTTVCTASAGERQAHCYSASDLTFIESYEAGDGYLANVEFDMNGNLFVGTDTSSSSSFDVQQHDRAAIGTPIQYSVSGSVRERNVVTSGDGLRLIVRSQGGQYITSLSIMEH